MNDKKMLFIMCILMVVVAFVFFIIGMMVENYNIQRIVNAIEVKEVTIGFNETKLVDYMMDKAKTQLSYNKNLIRQNVSRGIQLRTLRIAR
jgi:hypothetical protein